MLETTATATATIPDELIPLVTYEVAAEYRIVAEQFADPERYELAAAMFDLLDMPTSAARMRDRAEHYRRLQEENEQ